MRKLDVDSFDPTKKPDEPDELARSKRLQWDDPATRVRPRHEDAVAESQAQSTTVNISRVRTQLELEELTDRRPIWTKDRLPVQRLDGVNVLAPTVRVDNFLLRPTANGIVYVSPSELSLTGFSLTLRRTVRPDGSIGISGGTAVISVSVYNPERLGEVALQRAKWITALNKNLIAELPWRFRAEPQRGMALTLEVPQGVAASEPLISTSPLAGAATIAVDLTEIGALAWKTALDHASGSTIPGVVHVTTSAPTANAFRPITRTFDTPLGSLLAGKTGADILYVDPQQTISGMIVVVASELVSQSSISVSPVQGEAPTTRSFDAAGGQTTVSITTQDVASASINWSAQVAFTPAGWPVIPDSGRLNTAEGWVQLIKPSSWLASFLLMVVPVDSSGHAQSAPSGDELQGALNFTAPYVDNGLLNSSFIAEYLEPVTVALPRYPSQPFGELVLTMFAVREGLGSTASRRLTSDERNVVILVYPDARMEIRTSADLLPELSTASEAMGMLEALG